MKAIDRLSWLVALLLMTGCSSGTEEYSTGMEDIKNGELNSCGFEDGMHSASVEYYNPKTGYGAFYTLDVEVDDCAVIRIEFPKGGWLDEDHISATELESDGTASIEDDEGRQWDISIDN